MKESKICVCVCVCVERGGERERETAEIIAFDRATDGAAPIGIEVKIWI